METVLESATSLYATWVHPDPDNRDGDLTGYQVYCDSPNGHHRDYSYGVVTSATLGGLYPYTSYVCCVIAERTKGTTQATCSGPTLTDEDVPSSGPTPFNAYPVSSTDVYVEWGPPASPNGVILSYTVYVNEAFHDSVQVSQNVYIVRNQSPGTAIIVGVSASNSIGESPVTQVSITTPVIDPYYITITRGGSNVAGNSNSYLTCVATYEYGLVSTPTLTWLDEDENMISSGDGITVGTTTSTGTGYMTTITIDVLKTSHAGVYYCQLATNDLLDLEFKRDFALEIAVPSPSIKLEVYPKTPTVTAGTSVTIACDVGLSSAVDTQVSTIIEWSSPDGSTLTSGGRYTITTSSNRYSALTIDPLTEANDKGQFSCFVNILDDVNIIGAYNQDSTVLSVVAPELSTVLSTYEIGVLDVVPYNDFSLTCTVFFLAPLTGVTRSVEWQRDGATLVDNGNSVQISTADSNSNTLVSTLTAMESSAGEHTYTCTGRVEVPSDQPVTASAEATVTVQGGDEPHPAVNMRVVFVNHFAVELEWTVLSIEYTLEDYYVKYGTSPDVNSLTTSSQTVTGSSDIESENNLFSVEIEGLVEETEYYYVVVSVNSFGETMSSLQSFITEELPLGVEISTMGDATAGEDFTLTCKVFEKEDISDVPSISWIKDGTILTAADVTLEGPTLGSETFGGATVTTYTYKVLLHPIETSDKGIYTCYAEVPGVGDAAGILDLVVHVVPLDVYISVNPDNGGSINYPAGSQIILTCSVTGSAADPLQYSWTSICTGECFVLGSDQQTVSRDTLRGADNGVHTCAVIDDVGRQGAASVTVSVVGTALWYNGILEENDLLLGNTANVLCLSGSVNPNIGVLLSPTSTDITAMNYVTVGDSDNPGYLSIDDLQISASNQGVYTCVMPNELGLVVKLHVGLYPLGYNTPISITECIISSTSNAFTLLCITTGSPVASMSWVKDGITFVNDGTHLITQQLTDGTTATFENALHIMSNPGDVNGLYIFRATDHKDVAVQQVIIVQGLTIVPSRGVFIAGEQDSLTCSSDHDVTRIEWDTGNSVVVYTTTESSLTVDFDPVMDSMHGRNYTCKVYTSHGVQEHTYTLDIQVSAQNIMVTLEQKNATNSGQPFDLMCTVTKTTGLENTPTIVWQDDDDGQRITIENNFPSLLTTVSTITYDPILHTDKTEMFCMATLVSPAPPYMVEKKVSTIIPIILPDPTLSVTVDSVFYPLTAGIPSTLTCLIQTTIDVTDDLTFAATWKDVDGNTITSNGPNTVSDAISTAPKAYISTVSINPLTITGYNGTTTCTVAITSTLSNVIGSTVSDDISLNVIAPDIVPMLETATATILDVEPFNDYCITCVATSSPLLTGVTRRVEWHEDGVLLPKSDYDISESGSHSEEITSTLCKTETVNGTKLIECRPQIQISPDEPVMVSAFEFITVQGPRNPNKPTGLEVVFATRIAANLRFKVDNISYTPEQYYIKYGLSKNALNQMISVNGSDRIDIVDMYFQGTIVDVVSETLYYYSVLAENTFGQTESDVASFTTDESSLGVAISTEIAVPTAGQMYSLLCTVYKEDAIADIKTLEWIGPDGNTLTTDDSITIVGPTDGDDVTFGTVLINTQTLELIFDPLKVKNEGNYTCSAEVSNVPIKFSTWDIAVTIDPLDVSVVIIPDNEGGTKYQAGSDLTLSCQVTSEASRVFKPLQYSWSSFCDGDCFVGEEDVTQNVTTPGLHGADNGKYTCTATDDVGNYGAAQIAVQVVGVTCKYDGQRFLMQNDIIIAEHDCAFGMLECFSGIVDGLVGTIVAPNGAQITHKSYVEVGGADNQGYLRIAERNLTNADTGVYTIAMPDDENLNMNFYIGLFCMGFNDSIRISELVCDTTPSIGFFVLCTSVDSPVQSITWEKNGMALIADGGHVIRQELVYGSKVQYNNQLYVLDGTESKSPDVYSCVVTDHFGNTIRKDISCACEEPCMPASSTATSTTTVDDTTSSTPIADTTSSTSTPAKTTSTTSEPATTPTVPVVGHDTPLAVLLAGVGGGVLILVVIGTVLTVTIVLVAKKSVSASRAKSDTEDERFLRSPMTREHTIVENPLFVDIEEAENVAEPAGSLNYDF